MKLRSTSSAGVCLALVTGALLLWPAPAAVSVVVKTPATASVAPGSRTVTFPPGPGGSVSPPRGGSITPVCGDPQPAKSLGPAPSLPSKPVHVIASGFAVQGFSATRTGVYVFDGSRLLTYSLSGAPKSTFALPSQFTGRNQYSVTGPVVDPAGDIWLDSYYGDRLDKFSPTGRLLWSTRSYATSSIVGLETRSGFRLGVTINTGHGFKHTLLLSDGGRASGSLPLALRGFVSQTPDGGALLSEGGYVQRYSPSWKLLSSFGYPETGSPPYTGAPYRFSQQGQAFEVFAGGPIYTLDAGTIEETTPQGFLKAATSLGGALQHATGSVYLVDGTLYFGSGTPYSSDQNISAVPLSTLESYLAAAAKPQTFGWGAGVTSGTPKARTQGNYFPYGTAPAFYASFVPTWAAHAAHLQLDYSIWSDADVRNGTYPPARRISLPGSPKALADIPLPVPARDGQPGAYQLQANLWDTAKSPHLLVGSTCVPYTVGAPGDMLDFSSLPSGAGFGGPADPRGVVLNSQLGLNGFRGAAIDWATFLPHCNPSKPSALACSPAAMTFTGAPQSYFQAAYLAQKENVTYWVQVSDGDSVSWALVKGGWWGPDVAALVAYYSDVSHCKVPGGQCAPVTAWEAWNEANYTFSPDGAKFVKAVLAPFYKGVKSASPRSTVVGGSSLGVDIPWWRQAVAAGALTYMDVAGVHPYTGNNDSWEEDGTIAQVRQLQALLHSKPIWFTEVGWWSDGPYNFLHQASTVAQAMVWMRVLGIPTWNYFFDEGGWGNSGVTFSLIQDVNSEDYVKPSALAAMEASQQLAGRKYLGSPPVPIPLADEALFSAPPGGSNNLAVLWTQGLSITGEFAVLTKSKSPVSVRLSDQWGNSRNYQLKPGQYYALPLSSELTYVGYPQGSTLMVAAMEPFGPDLALSSSGAKATTSSSQPAGSSSVQPCCSARDAIRANPVGGWEPAGTDPSPTITVRLPYVARIDRVLVDGHSLGSLIGDPRNFTVEVEGPAGKWAQVAAVKGAFYQRATLVQFSPVRARAVRVTVQEANYGGYAGGGVPSFWSSTTPLTMEIHAIDVYGAHRAGAPFRLGTSSPVITTTTQ